MPTQRDIRKLAMQVLYQIDLRGPDDREAIHANLEDWINQPETREQAFRLAQQAWDIHDQCDALATRLAPQWPTHRQPPIDRAILRLAYYELVSRHAPVGVVINEAVVLSKQFCAERSPGFINGVLDKMAKTAAPPPRNPPGPDQPVSEPQACPQT